MRRQIRVEDDLVLMGDTGTNAGFDTISTYRELDIFERPGEQGVGRTSD